MWEFFSSNHTKYVKEDENLKFTSDCIKKLAQNFSLCKSCWVWIEHLNVGWDYIYTTAYFIVWHPAQSIEDSKVGSFWGVIVNNILWAYSDNMWYFCITEVWIIVSLSITKTLLWDEIYSTNW